MALPSIPDMSGHLANVAVAGGGSGDHVVIAGDVTGDDARHRRESVSIRIDAAFGGTLTNAHIGRLRASGPWGRFDGSGAFSTQAFVATGHYRGTFEGLQPFLGNAIPAHGALSGRDVGGRAAVAHRRAGIALDDARRDAARRSHFEREHYARDRRRSLCASTRRTRARPAATSLPRERSQPHRRPSGAGTLSLVANRIERSTAARPRSAAG